MDLIRSVLDLIRQRLNQAFGNLDSRVDDWVILSNLTGQDRQLYPATRDKVVMVLTNIKHETVVSTYSPTVRTKTSSYAVVPPPLYIDLFVLFYANFYDDNYRQGLAMISRTISYFQQNPWFDASTMPDLPPGVDKLTLEITNLDLLELNYLMGMLGVSYLPCVFYKLRMLPFAGERIEGVTPAVGGDTTQANAPV
jgi:hypothetical protein